MRTHSLRSGLCSLFFLLIMVIVCGSPLAVEIHVVGEAAYKFVDGEWIQTALERMGDMTAIWAFSENDIFIGNRDGVVYRYDGITWEKIYVDINGRDIMCIWGTSNTNVYIGCGNIWDNIGIFLHYDGNTCTEIFGYGVNDRYFAVYGFAENDIYVAAQDWDLKNRLYHNSSGDPFSWELVDLPAPIENLDNNFTGVWGSSSSDVFVSGYRGLIIHWDGTNWEQIESGLSDNITDIWGSSGTDVFFTGSDSVAHYNGDTCTVMSQSGMYALKWIIGDSSTNVLVGGVAAGILRYDGNNWVVLPGEDVNWSEDAHMFSSDHALIPDREGIMLCYNGSSIERCDQEYFPVRSLNAVSGTGTGNVYAVADEGYVYHYDGNTWSEIAQPTTNDLTDIIAFADDDICVIDYQATYHYNGVSWELLGGEETAGGYAMWGLSSDDLYAAISYRIYHYDGTEWTTVYSIPPTSTTRYAFMDIWGTSSDDIYAVGYYNYSGEYGVHWVDYSCPTIRHYDGIEWTSQSSGYFCPTGDPPAGDNIFVAIWGSSANDIWVGGDLDQPYLVVHNNGNGWDPVSAPFTNCEAIWGEGAYTYFLDGDDGDVYLYTNLEWSSWNVSNAYMRDMWGTGESGPNVMVTVRTEPENRKIYVDGDVCYETVSFGAEPGSTFEVVAVSPQSTMGGAEYYFVEWSDGGAIDHYIVVPDTSVTFTAYFYGLVDVIVTTEPEGLEFTVDGSTYTSPYTAIMVCGDEFDIGTVSPQRDKGSDYYFVEWSDGGTMVHTATVPHFIDEVFTATFSDIPTGDETDPLPLVNSLHQNHPNPFNPVTTISFSLRERGRALLAVYDVAGRLVRVLADGVMDAGPHEVAWDGRDREGRAVASGVYFYRLETGAFMETKKMVLLR